MAIINTGSYPELYSLVTIEWDNAVNDVPVTARASGVFNEMPFPDGTGISRRVSQYDFELYAQDKPQGAPAAIQRQQLGYYKDIILSRRALNVEYTYEGQHYEKYSFNTDAVREAKNSLLRRLDIDLQHRFTFGFSTSYVDMSGATVDVTVGDGLALFSTAHTLLASSLTYRNILANNPQLSRGSLEAMEKMWIENTLDNFGLKLARPADTLWTTDNPNSVNTAREILKSTAEISAPNAGVVNVYQGKYKHQIFPLIATDAAGSPDDTKVGYWGLIAKGKAGWQAYLGVNEEAHIMPMQMSNSIDVRTDNTSIPARIGYGIAVLSGQFCTVSKGNGDA